MTHREKWPIMSAVTALIPPLSQRVEIISLNEQHYSITRSEVL